MAYKIKGKTKGEFSKDEADDLYFKTMKILKEKGGLPVIRPYIPSRPISNPTVTYRAIYEFSNGAAISETSYELDHTDEESSLIGELMLIGNKELWESKSGIVEQVRALFNKLEMKVSEEEIKEIEGK